ncbi:MAG: fluoride efflux transporter CrcB [Solirubrobacterales bacterium]
MSLLVVLGLGALGGLGSVARFLVDGFVGRRSAVSLPLGTLAVNLSGSLLLGVLAGASTDENLLRIAATGLLGSYTTFSTWMFESQRLGEDGELRLGLVNFAVSLAGGMSLAWIGMKLGEAL